MQDDGTSPETQSIPEDDRDRFFEDCRHGNLEAVNELIKRYPNIVNIINKVDETPLHVAVSKGNLELVDLLIESGAEINAKDDRGYTPLLLACSIENININIVNNLIAAGANLDVIANANAENLTPLTLAAEFARIDIVKDLLSAGAAIASGSFYIDNLFNDLSGNKAITASQDALVQKVKDGLHDNISLLPNVGDSHTPFFPAVDTQPASTQEQDRQMMANFLVQHFYSKVIEAKTPAYKKQAANDLKKILPRITGQEDKEAIDSSLQKMDIIFKTSKDLEVKEAITLLREIDSTKLEPPLKKPRIAEVSNEDERKLGDLPSPRTPAKPGAGTPDRSGPG